MGKGSLTEELWLHCLNVLALQATPDFCTEGFFSQFTLSSPACFPTPIIPLFSFGFLARVHSFLQFLHP